nr:immunoglobulin heavy chain junction region [Macaca mulatta]MOV52809.1 immunoglobulin heavy chain junction region [Macaca mulatta]
CARGMNTVMTDVW